MRLLCGGSKGRKRRRQEGGGGGIWAEMGVNGVNEIYRSLCVLNTSMHLRGRQC